MAAVPRMRTIQQCAEYFLTQDPETSITAYRIRQMALGGEVPFVMCGKKYLINLDKLIDILSCKEEEPQPEKKPEPRRLKVRKLMVV